MKANEAPEKIYLQDSMSTDTIGDLCPEWFDAEVSDDSIEYTRTDAFIRKACEWLEENKDHPLIGCEDPCLSGYLTSFFIEDFRKAMKGDRQ